MQIETSNSERSTSVEINKRFDELSFLDKEDHYNLSNIL